MRYKYVCDDDAAWNVVDLRREKETLDETVQPNSYSGQVSTEKSTARNFKIYTV